MSQPNDAQAAGPCHAPKGWTLLNRRHLPKTFIPYRDQTGFEQALLVRHDTLQETIASVVIGSATMKAWFALMFPQMRQRDACVKTAIAPTWEAVWGLISKQKATWNDRYDTNVHHHTTHWELHEPSSVGELYALAMFVLYRKVQDNPEKDDIRVAGLKWHKYYREDEEKYHLLFLLLIFMRSFCAVVRGFQFRRPTSVVNLSSWEYSRGGRMQIAVQRFLHDNNWSPKALFGYKVLYPVAHDKDVGLTLNEGSAVHKTMFREVNDIFQAAQNYFTQGAQDADAFGTNMCAMLRWPSNVIILKASIRGKRDQETPIGRIEDFLEYVRKDAAPWVCLEMSPVAPRITHHFDQADYSRHPVLQLEQWVDTLPEQDAGYAASLFTLLRRNHRLSRDFLKDLTELFAPLRQLNILNSERSRSLLETFEDQTEASSHASHLERIESLATQLDEASAEDARAVIHLIRRGFRTCRDSMDELKVIFGPVQQRNAELERAVQIRNVFDAIDKEALIIDVG